MLTLLDWNEDSASFRLLEERYRNVIVAVYRGRWCAVCCAWLSRFQDTPPSLELLLERNDACLVLVSAQDAGQMQRLVTEIPGLQAKGVYLLSDETVDFANWWNKRGFGEIFISPPTSYYGYRYPHGLLQPALFILSDSKLVYSWSSRPRLCNLGGAIKRPDPSKVLAVVVPRCPSEAETDGISSTDAVQAVFRERTWVFFGRILRRLVGSP
jgi:peroxiredoxin